MIDFNRMAEVADKMEKATTEEKLDYIRQIKHEYILGIVSFICIEFEDHKKVCEEEKCDWCDAMCEWLENELYNTRVECHANVIMNFTVKDWKGLWPFTDKEMEEAISNLVPQIKAQISQGREQGVVKLEPTPPKGKRH